MLFTIEACGICSQDDPKGWTYAFPDPGKPESYHESYSSGILPDKNFPHCNFIKREKWMKGYALKKWESTLNFVFMPMDTM